MGAAPDEHGHRRGRWRGGRPDGPRHGGGLPAVDHHGDAANLASAIGFQSGWIEALLGLAEARWGVRDPGALDDARAPLATARNLGYGQLAGRAARILTGTARSGQR